MEQLNTYLAKMPRGYKGEFAKLIGIKDTSLSRYLSGERMPRPDVIKRIAQATKGEVSPSAWYE